MSQQNLGLFTICHNLVLLAANHHFVSMPRMVSLRETLTPEDLLRCEK